MKLLYEVKCKDSKTCPKVVLDEDNETVCIIDDNQNKVSLTIEQFNILISDVKSGKIKAI